MSLQNVIRNSDPGTINAAIGRIKNNHFPSNRWIGPRNRFAKDTLNKIRLDGANPRYFNQISDYIAASAILHCTDGWTYLSNAIQCLLNGEIMTSVHFAYYAELRAVTSFLAFNGIGIFNRKHCYVKNASAELFNGQGTHKTVQDTIDEWSELASNSSRLLDLFSVNGLNFSKWLSAAGFDPGTPTISELARGWLKNWSIDLKNIEEDQKLRNEVSYRPQNLTCRNDRLELINNLKTIIEFWKACEPSVSDRFKNLDLHLLRLALEKTYKKGGKSNPKGFHNFINKIFINLGIENQEYLKEFSIRKEVKDDLLILSKASEKGIDRRGFFQPLPIISRAILLLRLSSASSLHLLKSNNINAAETKFCWNKKGNEGGLWEDNNYPNSMTDLWADIEVILDSISNWCEQNPTKGVFNAHQDLAFDLWQFNQFQKIGLWAIGL